MSRLASSSSDPVDRAADRPANRANAPVPVSQAFNGSPRAEDGSSSMPMTRRPPPVVERIPKNDEASGSSARSRGPLSRYGLRPLHRKGEIDCVSAWGIPRARRRISGRSQRRPIGLAESDRMRRHFLTLGGRVTAPSRAGDEVTVRVTLSSLPTATSSPPPSGLLHVRPRGCRALTGTGLAEVTGLDVLPDLRLPGEGDHLRGAISFSPSIDYMEQAYDDAKSGRFSRRPYIDMVIPTLVDPSMAPPGKHVMSCFVQYAPYRLAEGDEWDDSRRDAFGEQSRHDRGRAPTPRLILTRRCHPRTRHRFGSRGKIFLRFSLRSSSSTGPFRMGAL